MKRWPLVLGVLLLVLCSLLAVASAELFGSSLIIDWAAYLVAGILGAALIVTLFSKRYVLAVVSFVLLLTAASYPWLSHLFHLQAVEKGKAYVAIVSPVLEKFRGEHGSYPESLSQVSTISPIPLGMQYGTLGDAYYFIINDPQDIDYDRYDSSNREWRRDN